MVKKDNKWINFVKEYAKKNNLKYNIALKQAKLHYNKQRGSGLVSDTIQLVKNKGKELLKNEANKLIDEGVNILKKKVGLRNGQGIIGDVLRYGKRSALDLVPIPGIVRDIGNVVGDELIKKTGLGMKKTKKNMGGSGLMPSGY